MSGKDGIERRIEREREKIADLQHQIQLSESFIQGLQEALRLIPRGQANASSTTATTAYHFRSGDTKNAYEVLLTSGKPMRIHDILQAIGKGDTRQNRASLASSLHRAAKKTGAIKPCGSSTFVASTVPAYTQEPVNLPNDFGDESKPNKEDVPF